MAENEYQEEGATEIDFVMRNYEYANMAADMGQCRFGFATDLKAVCAKGDSGATVYKFLKDASGSSNTASTRILFADANGAASSHASLTFDGTTLKIAGALRKAGESSDNLTLGAAGLVTLGGNLALGANTISGDGAPNKGFGVGETGIPTVTATAVPSGDIRTVLRLFDDTALGEGNGAGITLYGKTKDDGTSTILGGIKVSKENGVSGDTSASFYIHTRGVYVRNALRLDSSQNGYIKNKLMVGSLTETPENQLSVFKDAEESVFLSVGNSKTGQNGVRIGMDQVLENGIPAEHVVFDMQYTTRAITFRSEGPVAGVYSSLMSLHYGPEEASRLDINGSLHVAGLSSSLVNVEAEDVSVNNLEVDDTFTAKLIKADWYSGHLPLYIKNATDAVYAKFETIEDVKTVTVADKLVVDGDLQVAAGHLSSFSNVEADNLDVDYALTAKVINVKEYDSNDYKLYIKGAGENIALFQDVSDTKKLTVYGYLTVDRNISVGRDLGVTDNLTVGGEIRCDTFRLDQYPTLGTITPDKYIIIKCNGTNYKIPVVAA